jgi:hypothetical protein
VAETVKLVPVHVMLVEHPSGLVSGNVDKLVAGSAHLTKPGQRRMP